MSLLARPLARGLLAVVILAGTVGAIGLVQVAERNRALTEAAALGTARAKQLRELVSGHLATLELRAQNAGSNPRLVAALGGNVSRDTLRDLFSTESWWQPFRESFASTYLAAPGGQVSFIAGGSDIPLPADALVARVRASRWVASALVAAGGRVHAVVAVPVLMPNPAVTPVLLLTQPFESQVLGQIAERTGEAVVLSDGKAALVGAGPSAQTSVLRQTIGRGPAGSPVVLPPGTAVASSEVAPGLWLLGHVNTRAAVTRATALFIVLRIGVGVIGGALFLLLLWSARRPVRSEPQPGAVAAAGAGPPPAEQSSGSRYVLLQRLGGGGMAEVHLAVAVGERGFRRPCVVKRLRPELTDNPRAVAQFTDEATLASSLVHANIVPIFDFAKVGDQYLLVEEYIVGRDLGKLVRKARAAGKRLGAPVVQHIGIEVLKALDYAHGKRDHDGLPLKLVHRDVSPDNIMVTQRGEVQLLDFGVLKSDDRRRQTDPGQLQGNLSFMAPEQARGHEVDSRADLFALGLVLYFALTGEPLYGNDTGYDLLLKAASGPGPAELAKLASLPAPFPAVLYRALSARPEARFPDAFSFAEALSPTSPDAAGNLAAFVNEMFGEELAEEQHQLGASSAGRLASIGSSGSGATVHPLRGHRGDVGPGSGGLGA
jgi:serine/threonine-protein kinase